MRMPSLEGDSLFIFMRRATFEERRAARRNWMRREVDDAFASRIAASRDMSRRSRQVEMWGARGELKAIDTSLTGYASTTERIVCVNACTQGSDIGNRVGRETLMRSVQVRGHFQPGSAADPNVVFWAVVYDNQTNAAAPVWTDVFTADGTYPQLRNLDNRKRFKVLGSGYLSLVGGTSVEEKYIPFEFYRKLKLPVTYNSTNGGTVADIATGGLFFMVRGTGADGTSCSGLSASARVRFADN